MERYFSEETERKAKKDDKPVYLAMGKKETAEAHLIIKRKRERNPVIRRLTYSLCIGRKT